MLGEIVNGQLSCKQNKKNKRDLDIAIEYNFSGQRCQINEKRDYKIR